MTLEGGNICTNRCKDVELLALSNTDIADFLLLHRQMLVISWKAGGSFLLREIIPLYFHKGA
jgi:hypothetical protein